VDGVEVARTEQAPQYEMCMILSMYVAPGTWTGEPNDVYPKTWDIDYVRVYKAEAGYGETETEQAAE
jgi:hypothetical protein